MNSTGKVVRSFADYVAERDYGEADDKVDMVVDFIAGMTDSYARKCFEELYWF